MSSRLNPRDYDLGELREAVRETPRRREDGRAVERRDPSRRDDFRSAERTAEAERQDGRESERPGVRRCETDEESSERRSSASARAEGRAAVRRSSDDRPSFDRSRGSPSDGRGAARNRRDGRSSVDRLRQNTARFARSKGRDRTADGEPRRRGGAEYRADDRRTEGRSERRDTGRRSPGLDTDAFELRPHGGADERPYLPRLPDSYDAQVVIFEWLEGLLATCGRESTLEALAYYESVGWLSADSRERLEEFVEGLTAAEPPEPRPLGVDHHRESLRYVARLARRIDR